MCVKCIEAVLEDSCIACVCVGVCVCVCVCWVHVCVCVCIGVYVGIPEEAVHHNDSISKVITVPHTSSSQS